MDRCEACPLLEGKRPIQEGCNGGLPVSVCIAQLQHNILKLEKSKKCGVKEAMILNQTPQKVAQLKLPNPADADPHPRLLLEGDGIHAGSCYNALFPDGWHEITLEVRGERTGPGCWYISTPGFSDICPVGLFVKI